MTDRARIQQLSLFDQPSGVFPPGEARTAEDEPSSGPLPLVPALELTELRSGWARKDDRGAVREPPSPENDWAGIDDLDKLRKLVLECKRCNLRSGAKGVVFGEGDPRATVMFVGEGPGETEDETGRPFVGRAGQLLDLMLKAIGFQRQKVFIANIVKCRPPGNRLPLPNEVEACIGNLRAQIRIIRPRIIVLLGALASQTLVDPSIRVTRDRGKWYEKDGIKYLVTYHPAAVLRDEYNKRKVFMEDFKSLRAVWEEMMNGKV